MKRSSIIRDKSFAFAIEAVGLTKDLQSQKEFVLSKQLLRSGTSIGAMIREAQYAESKKDFIHKLAIGLKEANETLYWLELLHSTDHISAENFERISFANIELIKLLTSSIVSAKKSIQT